MNQGDNGIENEITEGDTDGAKASLLQCQIYSKSSSRHPHPYRRLHRHLRQTN